MPLVASTDSKAVRGQHDSDACLLCRCCGLVLYCLATFSSPRCPCLFRKRRWIKSLCLVPLFALRSTLAPTGACNGRESPARLPVASQMARCMFCNSTYNSGSREIWIKRKSRLKNLYKEVCGSSWTTPIVALLTSGNIDANSTTRPAFVDRLPSHIGSVRMKTSNWSSHGI